MYQIHTKGVATTKNERREKIRALLLAKPYISYNELEELFPSVTGMTIRRDIDALEASGEVIKVRGGARSMKFITNRVDDTISARMTENVTSKDFIAKRASEYLETGRSIFIDSGTTLEHIVSYVPNERFIFTTTNPSLAVRLAEIGQPAVNIVGGRLDADYMSIYGPQAMRSIAETNIDIAFLSASGLSARSGCSGGNASECELKRAVAAKAQKTILLIDRSKVGKCLPYTFCELEDIDIIITDAPLPDDIRLAAEKNGVKIITA